MSVIDATFNLCKEMKKLQIFDQARKLLKELRESNPGGRDRSFFGQTAEQGHIQFLGYLLLDESKDKINQKLNALEIENLQPEEKLLILKCHLFIHNLNNKCIELFKPNNKILDICLNPYFRYPYSLPKRNIDKEFHDVYLQVDKLLAEIKQIKDYHRIFNYPYKVFTKSPRTVFAEATATFEDRINESGVHASPPDFYELERNSDKNSHEYKLNQLFNSMVSFRGILRNIDQLIYQNIRYEKLYVLNEDCIIDVKNTSNHLTGRGQTILSQPSEGFSMSLPGQIVLVNYGNKKKFCVVHKYSFSFNHETGMLEEFGLRELDSNLSMYYPE